MAGTSDKRQEAVSDPASDPLDMAPAGMVGWVEEAAAGEPLAVARPGEVRLRVVVSGERVVVIALGQRAEEARALIERLGLRPELLRRMLCG